MKWNRVESEKEKKNYGSVDRGVIWWMFPSVGTWVMPLVSFIPDNRMGYTVNVKLLLVFHNVYLLFFKQLHNV